MIAKAMNVIRNEIPVMIREIRAKTAVSFTKCFAHHAGKIVKKPCKSSLIE